MRILLVCLIGELWVLPLRLEAKPYDRTRAILKANQKLIRALSDRGSRLSQSVTYLSPPSIVHLPILGQATETEYNWNLGPGYIIQ